MTPREFRGTQAWKQARRLAMATASRCAICGQPFRRDWGPRQPLAPSVDHRIPLAKIDLNTAEGRALAVHPGNLRVVHVGCNSSRGARSDPAGPAATTGRCWSRCWDQPVLPDDHLGPRDVRPCGAGRCAHCRGVG